MKKKDYYEILNVSKDASDVDIKKAYRKLVLEFHPDKRPGDKEAEEKIKEINEAYSVLGNAEKKAQYDKYGHGFERMNSSYDDLFGSTTIFEDLIGDVFSDFFGTRGASNKRVRGRDVETVLELEFEEAVLGTEKEIPIERIGLCDVCSGTGAKPGTKPITCRTCGGRGQINYRQGFLTVTRTCNVCNGAGYEIIDKCRNCGGTGRIRRQDKIKINIPAGVDNESVLRIQGKGSEGYNGGASGDLHIIIKVKDHQVFKRDGHDIILDTNISFTQAVLGDTIKIPTLYGEEELKITPGTNSGQSFILKHKGVTSPYDRRKGDQVVKVHIEVPKYVTERQKELLKEFDEILKENKQNNAKGIFDKVKDLFQ